MPRKNACRAKNPTFCRDERCPERIQFFSDHVRNPKAKEAAERVTQHQLQMRTEGMKGTFAGGVRDVLPDVKQTYKEWSKEDHTRLEAMLAKGFQGGEVQKVRLGDIQTVRQSLFKFSALAYYLDQTDSRKTYGEGVYDETSMPVVVRNGDQLALVDGTHRYMKGRLLGEDFILAKVVDLV